MHETPQAPLSPHDPHNHHDTPPTHSTPHDAHHDAGAHDHAAQGPVASGDASGAAPEHAARLPAPGAEDNPNVSDTFDATRTFADLGLRNSCLKGIEACGFTHPTKTQAMLIPSILAGKDVLGQAKTGTGKTAAFGLPLLNTLERDKPFQALVLAPTRELAIQITGEIEDLGRFTPIRAVTIYGGEAIQAQQRKLEGGAQILVGTPGRIMDMLERGHIHFNNIRNVVLDEVDRMLDIGFRDDIKKILSKIPNPERQTVFVSATISEEIEGLARRFMRDNAVKIVVASGSLTVNLVKQYYLPVNAWDKKRLLLHLLRHEEPALTVVFCRLKRHVDEIAHGLTARGIDAHAIHGDMPQGKRNRTMDKLREGKLSVLVASDLASRGIDVDDITHVINFDLPEDPEVYVHRIGRTARAGRGGIAWSFVTPEQGELLTNIEMLINQEVPRFDYPDFVPSDTPPPSWRPPRDSKEARSRGLTLATPPTPPPPPPAADPGVGTPVHAAPEAPAPSTPAAPAPAPRTTTPPPPPTNDPSKFPSGVVPTKLPPRSLAKGIRRK